MNPYRLGIYKKTDLDRGPDEYEIDVCIPLRMVSSREKRKFKRHFCDRLTRGGS